MADPTLDPSAEAAQALHAAVEDYGQRALSNPQVLTNLFKDLLPTLPREASLLVQAAEAGVADQFLEHIGQQMPPDAAVQLTAAAFGQRRAIDPAACSWVTAQFAAALGYPVTMPSSLSSDVSSPPLGGGAAGPPASPSPPPGYFPSGDLGTTIGAPPTVGPTVGAPVGGWGPGGSGPAAGPFPGAGGPPAGGPPAGGPPAGGAPAGGPPWAGPPPGQRTSGSKRTPLLLGGGAVAVVVVLVVIAVALAGSKSSGSPHPPTTQQAVTTGAPTTVATTTPPTTTPATTPPAAGGFVDLAQLLPSDINSRTDCQAVALSDQPTGMVGATAALRCTDAGNSSQNDPGVPNGHVYGFQFDDSANFIASVQAFNSDNSFDPKASGNGTSCPPSEGNVGGQVAWNNSTYQGELECYSNSSNGPIYVWTIPAQNALLVAVGAPPETLTQLDKWWTDFSAPST